MLINLIFLLSTIFNLSTDKDISILTQGFTNSEISRENYVINNEKDLKKVWKEFGIQEPFPKVDFKKEIAVVITHKENIGDTIEVKRILNKTNKIIEIRYVVKHKSDKLNEKGKEHFSYLIAKLTPSEPKQVDVNFIQENFFRPIAADTALGQIPTRANVIRGYESMYVSEYVPIDKGNTWTYKVETEGKVKEERQSVLTVSDGWSVIDKYFGKENIGIRIDQSGNILVSYDGSVKNFYTPEVERNLVKRDFSTPAGKFNDLMVVTIPKNEKFWFMDVYAKGVGLIYHEHESPKGNAKYSLIDAQVRGKKYP
ncbi:hypothetical protein MYX76_11065 [Desulfobacterota bacterium AH_259_B03_O07]|nr:hypothetical protein [Desulfobacterota bacterium AH_259_B03_O07]